MIKSKTLWFSVLLAAFAMGLETMPAIKNSINEDTYSFIFLAISIIIAILRAATNKSLMDK